MFRGINYFSCNYISTTKRNKDRDKGGHLTKSTPNLPQTANAKTPFTSKANANERKSSHNISKLESFISQQRNKLRSCS